MPENPRQTPTLDELRAHRDEIMATARRNLAFNIRIFGSVARGDATPDSDIDLLVDFGAEASLYELARLRNDLEELLGRQVDVVEDHPGLGERFRRRLSREMVPL